MRVFPFVAGRRSGCRYLRARPPSPPAQATSRRAATRACCAFPVARESLNQLPKFRILATNRGQEPKQLIQSEHLGSPLRKFAIGTPAPVARVRTTKGNRFSLHRFTPTMFRKPLDSLTTNVVRTPLLASREENNVGSQERTVFFFETLPL
jgi:hypothetical protein